MKKYLQLLLVALFATLTFPLTSCINSKETKSEVEHKSEAEKMFASIETVKDGLTHECFFLSKDGKCLVVFFDDTVEIDAIDEDGKMNELFKSDELRITTNSKGMPYIQIGQRAEFSPKELIIFSDKTYTDFNLYSASELMKMGVKL